MLQAVREKVGREFNVIKAMVQFSDNCSNNVNGKQVQLTLYILRSAQVKCACDSVVRGGMRVLTCVCVYVCVHVCVACVCVCM